MDRVMRSMDASLTGMSIMTARSMPKQVYLEDVIERIIHFSKFQLHNTIYPEFDPVYKLDPKSKGKSLLFSNIPLLSGFFFNILYRKWVFSKLIGGFCGCFTSVVIVYGPFPA